MDQITLGLDPLPKKTRKEATDIRVDLQLGQASGHVRSSHPAKDVGRLDCLNDAMLRTLAATFKWTLRETSALALPRPR